MNDLIDPLIIFPLGRCIRCGGQLTVVDMETTFMNLSSSGMPVDEDTIIRCNAVCRNCGNEFPMMRWGERYVPETNYTRFMKRYFDNKKQQEIINDIEKQRPTEDNPFCINTKGQS